MKKIMLIVSCFMVTSCGGWVTEKELRVYSDLCANNGGIRSVSKWMRTTLTCNNYAVFYGIALSNAVGDAP